MLAAALTGILSMYPKHAQAHPLGNFSINQYFLLDLRAASPEIYYLLDIAEIPSFSELDLLDADYDNEIVDEEVEAYLDLRSAALAEYMAFSWDGQASSLRLTDRRLILLEGTGGMTVFNVILKFEPETWSWPVEGEVLHLEVESLNYAHNQGVREAKLVLDGRFVDDTSSLGEEALRYQTLIYLDDKKNPVYQDFDAQFLVKLDPGTGRVLSSQEKGLAFTWTATARSADEVGENALLDGLQETLREMSLGIGVPESLQTESERMARADPPEDLAHPIPNSRFSQTEKVGEGASGVLLDRVSMILRSENLSSPLVALALCIAIALGMGHAFSPGHGKTVMAAYLIGERGTIRHAVTLGCVVTFIHTWSVLLLGLVTLSAQGAISEQQLSFWAGIASGAIIAVIGGILFIRRYGAFVLARRGESPAHAPHRHAGEHSEVSASPHKVSAEHRSPPTYGSIIALGFSGGIVPCPAALIVLLLAIKLGRLALGLGLIVAFSAGLAAVLVVIGIVVVRTAGKVRKRIGERSSILLALPVASSVLITCLGLSVVLWTLLQHNVIVFLPSG